LNIRPAAVPRATAPLPAQGTRLSPFGDTVALRILPVGELFAFSHHRRSRRDSPTSQLGERNPAVRAAEAASGWARVPMTGRYAAEPLRRGRRRISVLLAMLTEVERAESQAEAVTDQAPSASEDTHSVNGRTHQ
jgi:hypothetical protein